MCARYISDLSGRECVFVLMRHISGVLLYPPLLLDEVFRGHEPGQATSRSVSAADVVLYGVNLILPLMSQDLLKVSTVQCNIGGGLQCN